MSRLLKAAWLGLIIGVVGVAISFFHFVHETEEAVGLGMLFRLRGAREAPANVAVVSIDRESSERLGVHNNPDRWPRTLHAGLVQALGQENARVIVFDVYFVEPGRSAEEDRALGEAIEKFHNVVLAEPLKTRQVPLSANGASDEHRIVQPVKPIDVVARSAFAAAPFVLPRLPVRVSQYWTFQSDAGDSPTFPVVALQLYALPAYADFVRLLRKASPIDGDRLPQDVAAAIKAKGAVRLIRDIRGIFENDPSIAPQMLAELNRSDTAVNDRNRYVLLKALIKMYGGANRRYLNYYGPPRTISTVPFYQALQLHDDPAKHEPIGLDGKAVFVGLSEILLAEKQDSFYTVFSQINGVFVSGVEIAATAFANLLEDSSVNMLEPRSYLLLILAWGILVGVVCRMASTVVAALGVIGLSLLYLFVAERQFATDGIWYPLVVPLFLQSPTGFFSGVLWNYFELNKERQNIRKALSYYVPDDVVDQLAKNLVDIRRDGQTAYGVCLFADAAGYTTISESMSPRELSDFMHKYLEATFEPIRQNGGRVVDLSGDSILAIWKAAQSDAGLRKQACQAAMGVAEAVHRFNQSFASVKLPARVSVHAGPIFLGNIGAADHYQYGPTGDTVNTASRMDGLNKYLNTEILVSEEVIQGLDVFLTREAGKFRLKGKTQPVVVHELLGRREESQEKQRAACAIYAEALAAFRRQSWDEAQAKLHRLIECSATDGLANFYLRLCAQYKQTAPPEPWEGVIDIEGK